MTVTKDLFSHRKPKSVKSPSKPGAGVVATAEPATSPKGATTKAQEGSSALAVQIAGGHYKKLAIQPVEYIHANNLPFIEGCIVKYATRWRDKGGTEDLKKIKHFVDLLIELEARPKP